MTPVVFTQYAYRRAPSDPSDKVQTAFVWYRNYRFQEFMDQILLERNDRKIKSLIGNELELFEPDIHVLEYLATNRCLPASPLEFYFENQEPEHISEDDWQSYLKFCAWARQAFRAGNRVFYACSWGSRP